MKRTAVLCAAALLLAASGIYAFGDIARPKVSPQPKEGKTVLFTSLSVVPDSKLSEARLQISQEMLQSIAREAARNPSTDETMTQRLMHSSKYQTSDTRDGRRTGSHIKKEQKAHHQSLRPGTLVLLKN